MHAARAVRGGGIEDSWIERSDKKRAAGGVGGQTIAVGEIHGDSGREPAIDVQHREGGAFSGNNALWQKQDTRGGCRWRLLREGGRKNGRPKHSASRDTPTPKHAGIVAEIAVLLTFKPAPPSLPKPPSRGPEMWPKSE